MKKILIVAICILVLLIGIIAVDAIVSNKGGGTVPVVSQYTDGDVQKTTVVEVPTKDRDGQVQFTMPLHYLEEKYRNNLDLFCQEFNYISCTIDEQAQTFTVTMNALNHDLMLIRMGVEARKPLNDDIMLEKFPFFKAHGEWDMEGLTEFTVFVDKAGYEASDKDTFTAYIAGCGIYYQLYTTSNEYYCKVIVKDYANGEIIDAKIFQQNNSGVIS